MTSAADNAAPASDSGTACNARGDGLDRALVEQPELGEARQRAPDFADGFARELFEIGLRPRLEIDDGDRVAGIGEHHGDAAAHAAGAETGDAFAAHMKPTRSKRLQLCAIERAEAEGRQACARSP